MQVENQIPLKRGNVSGTLPAISLVPTGAPLAHHSEAESIFAISLFYIQLVFCSFWLIVTEVYPEYCRKFGLRA